MSKKNKGKWKAKFHSGSESRKPETLFGSELRGALERLHPTKEISQPNQLKKPQYTAPLTPNALKKQISNPRPQIPPTLGTIISKISQIEQPSPEEDERLWAEAVQALRSTKRQNEYEQRILNALSEQERRLKKGTVSLILGIDMGTSITKVVWREEEASVSKPVCFGTQRHLIDDYFIPSMVAFDGSRFAAGPDITPFLAENPKAGTYSHFKMCLSCVSTEKTECNLQRCPLSHWRPVLSKMGETEALKAICALHLAKVISLSKRIITDDFRSRGITSHFRWIVNLAAPVEHMNDTSVLKAFEVTLRTAWLMAEIFDECPGPRELGDLLDCYESAGILEKKRTLDCFVYPEVGAEVASLYLSRSVRDGIYAFVDIGAGTVDGSIFRLYSESQHTKLSFYGGVVLKQGAAHFEAIASRQLAEISMPWYRNVKEKKFASETTKFLDPNEARSFLDFASFWIGDNVERGIGRLLGNAYKKEQIPHQWREIVLLTGGGGSEIPIYTDVSKKVLSRLATGLVVEKLRKPQDFDMGGLPSIYFHRFAVAYGLSFDTVNLAEITLPNEMSELSQRRGKKPECPTPDVG